MADIKINKEDFIEGKLSIERELIKDNGEEKVLVRGTLSTHEYIEEINTIESERYLLQNIKVYKEYFGSNDYNIGYSFFADSLTIKPDYIPEEIKAVIQTLEYQEEEEELYHSKNWEKALEIYEKATSNS